jgi:hypothetical protein
VVENAFGIMANRFRVLLTPIATNIQIVDDIVLTCCVLHNFLRRKSTSYIQHRDIDTEDITTGNILVGDRHTTGELLSLEVTRIRRDSVTANAKNVRD